MSSHRDGIRPTAWSFLENSQIFTFLETKPHQEEMITNFSFIQEWKGIQLLDQKKPKKSYSNLNKTDMF